MQLPNRDQLDDEAAALLTELSEQQQRELVAHLGNPPLWENVPATFWRRMEREVEERAALILLLVYVASGEFHGIGADTAERGGRGWSHTNASRIAQGYVETTQQRLRQSTDDWLGRMLVEGKQITDAEIVNRVGEVLGPNRQRTVASDLVTLAQTAGGEAAIDVLGGLSDDDTWFTERDGRVCPICEPLHAQPRTIWAGEVSTGPPAHPRCRCWIVYANAPASLVGAN